MRQCVRLCSGGSFFLFKLTLNCLTFSRGSISLWFSTLWFSTLWFVCEVSALWFVKWKKRLVSTFSARMIECWWISGTQNDELNENIFTWKLMVVKCASDCGWCVALAAHLPCPGMPFCGFAASVHWSESWSSLRWCLQRLWLEACAVCFHPNPLYRSFFAREWVRGGSDNPGRRSRSLPGDICILRRDKPRSHPVPSRIETAAAKSPETSSPSKEVLNADTFWRETMLFIYSVCREKSIHGWNVQSVIFCELDERLSSAVLQGMFVLKRHKTKKRKVFLTELPQI